MTGAVVVDASVAIKCVLDEEHSDNAHGLLGDTFAQRDLVAAPPLLSSEVTNAVYQRERRRLITTAEAHDALRQFLSFPIHLLLPANLFVRALALARQHGLSATYDSQYLALAESLGADLWTADTRLIRSLSGATARVHWIGDYPV